MMSVAIVATLSGAVVHADSEACSLLGKDEAELEGTFFGDLFLSPYRASTTLP